MIESCMNTQGVEGAPYPSVLLLTLLRSLKINIWHEDVHGNHRPDVEHANKTYDPNDSHNTSPQVQPN